MLRSTNLLDGEPYYFSDELITEIGFVVVDFFNAVFFEEKEITSSLRKYKVPTRFPIIVPQESSTLDFGVSAWNHVLQLY